MHAAKRNPRRTVRSLTRVSFALRPILILRVYGARPTLPRKMCVRYARDQGTIYSIATSSEMKLHLHAWQNCQPRITLLICFVKIARAMGMLRQTVPTRWMFFNDTLLCCLPCGSCNATHVDFLHHVFSLACLHTLSPSFYTVQVLSQMESFLEVLHVTGNRGS